MLGKLNYIIHVLKRVPWSKAEHKRNGNNILAAFHHLNNLVMSVTPS